MEAKTLLSCANTSTRSRYVLARKSKWISSALLIIIWFASTGTIHSVVVAIWPIMKYVLVSGGMLIVRSCEKVVLIGFQASLAASGRVLLVGLVNQDMTCSVDSFM